MFELINQNQADRIKEILETTWLYKSIQLDVDRYSLKASAVSESNDTEHHEPYRMKEFYLVNDENDCGVIEEKNIISSHKNKKYNAFVNVGEWGPERRLHDTHITLGSDKFHDFCFQIELSQAVSDEDNIYIIKNISNMAGKGAICRLYRGLKTDKEKKRRRQKLFIKAYGNEVISYENKDWVVIAKIKKEELYDDNMAEEIFHDLIHNMFLAMLTVESIGDQDKNK